jgi:excisionase family DNA binding protein
MSERDEITFNNLPEAVKHLIKDVEEIKNLLLNQSASQKPIINNGGTENDILTVEEVAQKLGLEKATVYNMTSKRQIPYFKSGGRIYFDRVQLTQWIRRDRRKTIKELHDEANLAIQKK